MHQHQKSNIQWVALTLVLAAISLNSISAFAQQQAYRSPAGTDYLLYTPPGYASSTSNFPLLISLHSKGEVGNDLAELTSRNPEQMPSRLIYLNRWPQALPFVVLTPQLRPSEADPDPQWSAAYIDEVVSSVMQSYRIDPARVCLTGISRGGTGVWTYASAYPGKIAAIVTLSGRSDLSQACPIKNIPIWAFHGDGDTVAPPAFSIDMVNAINSCSPTGHYRSHLTILNAKGHDGWNEVYNGSNGYRVFEWLLQFRKNDLSNRPPYVSAGPDYKIENRPGPVTLVGDYFDADGTITNVTWQQTSGTPLTLINPNGRFLSLGNLRAGLYTFQLSVSDDQGLSSHDQVTIEILETASTLKVTELILVNGKTNIDIGPLFEGMVVDKSVQGLTEINVRAVTTSDVLSTRFSINADANTRTVNSTSSFYLKPQTTAAEWKVQNGQYVVCATPFSKSAGAGVRGTSQCYHVTFTDGIQACANTGTITRDVWNNITGKAISSIPLSTPPSLSHELQTFVSPSNVGDNYGARVHGYICPPLDGSYVFFISSDDNSELWLSSDENPSNKVKIASVSGYTNKLQWEKYPSQKSLSISLQKNKRYYIEALHKEATGGDHLAVGWQLPNQAFERPISGNRLIPFTIATNNPPSVAIKNPQTNQTFTNPSAINILADAFDTDGNIVKVEFFRNAVKLGEDTSSPFEFNWSNPVSGNSTLTAMAVDDDGATATSPSVTITVEQGCVNTGSISAEYWMNTTGTSVLDIPVNSSPTSSTTLSIFESPSTAQNNYGTRIRGYLCPPVTGQYKFWVASDDKSELWLSTNELPDNKQKIASVTGYTSSRQWTKYLSQESSAISLIAGKKYFVEVLHKEGSGADHVAVGWQLPDGILERPIPGIRLSPFVTGLSSSALREVNVFEQNGDDEDAIEMLVYPNPVTSNVVRVVLPGNADNYKKIRVQVFSIEGKEVVSKTVEPCNGCSSFEVNFDQTLKPGLYLMVVSENAKSYRKKIAIQ